MQVLVIYPADTKKSQDAHFFYVPPVSNDDSNAILETVFRQFNHVDGTEHIAKLSVRSMCVGDIVAFMEEQGRKFICDSIGWKQVSKEFVDAYLEAKIPFADRMMGLKWVLKKYPYL
jgi:hypothetical protein